MNQHHHTLEMIMAADGSYGLRAQQIQAAKERFAALPEWRQKELLEGFNKASRDAQEHQDRHD